MACAVENWSSMNGSDDIDEFEISEMDGALLMSLLLEESHYSEEDCDDDDDDERLKSVIRSLEAEIDHPNMILDGQDSSGSLPDQWGQQDCSVSCDDDFRRWMDMEMVPSSLSDEMNSWYVNHCDDPDIEFGDVVADYPQTCYGLEDHYSYESLWQETSSSMMMM